MPVNGSRRGAARRRVRSLALVLGAAAAAILLPGCDGRTTTAHPAARAAPTPQRIPLASGIALTTQDELGTRQRITADRVSVTPRPYGPFNLNGVNELRVERASIDLYPRTREAQGSTGKTRDPDFATLLRDYFERERDTYGYIARLRMDGVSIRLLGAGHDGSDIRVEADMLVRDFRNGSPPRLFNVSFSDSAAPGRRFAPEATWDTATNRFSIVARPTLATR